MKKEFFIAIGMCLTLLIGFFTTNTSPELDVHNVKIITVKSGDTLWDIAAANSSNSVDVREMVHALKDINELGDSGNLEPGSTLKVPTIQNGTVNTANYVASKE